MPAPRADRSASSSGASQSSRRRGRATAGEGGAPAAGVGVGAGTPSPLAALILESVAELGARHAAMERVEELRAAMLRALEILHAVRALFEVKPGVTRAEFGRFVRGALERLPELQALEWIPRLPAAGRGDFEAALAADDPLLDGLRAVTPEGGLAPAPAAEEYWPVAYVEPAEENTLVRGLDLRADADRRAALSEAARGGEPVATTPLHITELGPRRLGFFVVLAVRSADGVAGVAGANGVSAAAAAMPWAAERPEAGTAGWVLAVFRVQRLVARIFAPLTSRGLRLEVRDLQDESTPAFTLGPAPAGPSAQGRAPWVYEQDLPLAGRVWRISLTPGASFCADDPEWSRRAAADLNRTSQEIERRANERLAEAEARSAALEAANRELRAAAERREAAERALARADAELSQLTDAAARQWGLAGLVGRGERFGRMLREVSAVQQGDARAAVLITGESGAGKELVARAIHYGGARAAAPFVRVDCAALPAQTEQAEVLLFGQVRGAGGGGSHGAGGGPGAASAARRGLCEQAEGGTLFFDEIGELSPALQARLLGLLAQGGYLPVGAETPRPLGARVIAGTHADLPGLVATGRFRQDLYYRLMHYHVAVPPLRERMEDVPLLARHFVAQLAAERKRSVPRLRPEALQRLLAHAYPGNVRELKHTLDRALIHASGEEIGAEHVVFAAPAGPPAGAAAGVGSVQQAQPVGGAAWAGGASAAGAGGGAGGIVGGDGVGDLSRKFLADLPLNLSEAEDILIARAIAVAEGNLSLAARLLGINRASLYRWQERRAAAGDAVSAASAGATADGATAMGPAAAGPATVDAAEPRVGR